MKKKKRNVRMQIVISESIDDKLDDLSEIMGMHKNEIVRVAIANYLFGMSESVGIVRDIAEKQMQEDVEKEDLA